jgi:hypothetical protein
MRTSLFLIALIIALFVGRYTPLYECSAATFIHEKVTSFLLVNDGEGNDKIIHEMNNYNIEFEKAIIKLLPDQEVLLTEILDTISDFTLDYTIGSNRYVKSSNDLEICLEYFTITKDKSNSSFLESEYTAEVKSNVYLYDGESIESFIFESNSSFQTTGLTTEFFIDANLTEFFLDQLHKSVNSYVSQEE